MAHFQKLSFCSGGNLQKNIYFKNADVLKRKKIAQENLSKTSMLRKYLIRKFLSLQLIKQKSQKRKQFGMRCICLERLSVTDCTDYSVVSIYFGLVVCQNATTVVKPPITLATCYYSCSFVFFCIHVLLCSAAVLF